MTTRFSIKAAGWRVRGTKIIVSEPSDKEVMELAFQGSEVVYIVLPIYC